MRQNAGRPGILGDPKTAGAAILQFADADQPPVRVFFGNAAAQRVPEIHQQRLTTWQDWNWLSAPAND